MSEVIRFNEHMCIVGFLAYAHETGLIDIDTKVNLMKNIQDHLKEKEAMTSCIDGETLRELMEQLKFK